jgi:U4/U6.U5 tri-snRNP-associated protein 2
MARQLRYLPCLPRYGPVLLQFLMTSAVQETAGRLRRYKLTKLPPFLIFHIKRFTSNNFIEEKNPTIVNYPLRGVDMRECTFLGLQLFVFTCVGSKRPVRSPLPDLDNPEQESSTMYDLVANITHSSTAGTAREDTTWKVHVHTRPGEHTEERWFQIQDLIVEEIQRQMVFLGESYIQVRSPGLG